jgi:glycosyltransferase involved in cell wall biosynthesis
MPHSTAPPRFSLVVSTVGRAAELRRLFDSLVAQTLADFEVIVVDQSHGAEIAEVVREFADRLRLHHEPMHERGLSRGRNRGLEFAQGELLGFPDDDCTLPPHYLQEVAARFDAHPKVDGLSTQARHLARFDPESGPIARDNIFFRFVEPAMYVRRASLGAIRFDDRLGVGSGTLFGADEGPDFVLRCIEQGLRWHYFHDLEVWHPNPMQEYNARAFHRAYSYGCGRGYLLRRHRFPKSRVAWLFTSTCGGMMLMFCTGRLGRGRFYANSLRGQLTGYFSREARADAMDGAPRGRDG